MNQPLSVGIIGDFDPNHPSRIAINNALSHAAGVLAVTVEPTWLPTWSLGNGLGKTKLEQFDALCAPGGSYSNVSGALMAIRFAREEGWPFIGT